MPTESHEEEIQGRFRTLAWCPVRYADTAGDSAELRLTYSASVGFTRFSFQVLDASGGLVLYRRGPEHAASADTALLAAWTELGVPAYAWQLSAIPSGTAFESALAAAGYAGARRELCRALYPLRMKVWADQQLRVEPLVLPPDAGFTLVDAFSETAENAEVRQAAEG
jgi:hypothetical protein